MIGVNNDEDRTIFRTLRTWGGLENSFILKKIIVETVMNAAKPDRSPAIVPKRWRRSKHDQVQGERVWAINRFSL